MIVPSFIAIIIDCYVTPFDVRYFYWAISQK